MENHKNKQFKIEDFINTIPTIILEDDYTSKGDVYFAFIDVLGFKQAYQNTQDDDIDNISEKFKKVFIHYFDLMKSSKFSMNDTLYAGQTSDSLYFYTSDINVLFDFLKVYSYFNLYSMENDVFFRGGIAKGSLHCKENFQFYGKSVINAYLLESEVAKFPITSIDSATASDLKSLDEKLYESLVLEKEDTSRYWLKPFTYKLHNFNLEFMDTSIICELNLDKIKKNILKNKEEFEFDSRNFQKYVFLENEYSEFAKVYYKEKNNEK